MLPFGKLETSLANCAGKSLTAVMVDLPKRLATNLFSDWQSRSEDKRAIPL
jgi:hypothetical protein